MVGHFKYTFEYFKHIYTLFHILFHPHVITYIKNTQTTLLKLFYQTPPKYFTTCKTFLVKKFSRVWWHSNTSKCKHKPATTNLITTRSAQIQPTSWVIQLELLIPQQATKKKGYKLIINCYNSTQYLFIEWEF